MEKNVGRQAAILRKLCEWKNVNILEAECCADHIHILMDIPPKMGISGFMGCLKEKNVRARLVKKPYRCR